MIHSDGDDSYRKLHNYFYPHPCQVTFAFRGATSDRTWIATVTAGGKSFVSEGKQKKEAKALAARKALDHFEQPQLPPDVMAAEDVAAASPEPQDSS
ncbi:hypothetical protein FRC03_011704 [Tulasnella sp. 419]|nr:hypothetical protein FRC03_011704 [Tulasnella sp. 419]